jgi:hypothetical protein
MLVLILVPRSRYSISPKLFFVSMSVPVPICVILSWIGGRPIGLAPS